MTDKKYRIGLILAIGFSAIIFLVYWINFRVQEGPHVHYKGVVQRIKSSSDGAYRAEIKFLSNPTSMNDLNTKYNDFQTNLTCEGYQSLKIGDQVLIHIILYTDGTIHRRCRAYE